MQQGSHEPPRRYCTNCGAQASQDGAFWALRSTSAFWFRGWGSYAGDGPARAKSVRQPRSAAGPPVPRRGP